MTELADGVFGLSAGKTILLISALPAESPFEAASCAFLVGKEKAAPVQPEYRKKATDLHTYP